MSHDTEAYYTGRHEALKEIYDWLENEQDNTQADSSENEAWNKLNEKLRLLMGCSEDPY